MGKKPYEQRTDIERIESQWRKLSGLHTREEWSAAVVRAATAAEIAANLAIRREFAARSQLDEKFVDSLLKWANGLKGKIDHLLLPLLHGKKSHAIVKKLESHARVVNEMRNGIAHRGEFCNMEQAETSIASAKTFIEGLVKLYEPAFTLKEKKS